MATPEQYKAAIAAIKHLAEKKIAALGWPMQSMARNALNDTLITEFAYAALDVVIQKEEPK